jgi:rSAM/selenodomain-associated transferase 2
MKVEGGGRGCLSIVIPALNEAPHLPAALAPCGFAGAEVIVVDGGSTDGTAALARAWGARVITSAPGRGRQMNAGAAAAAGDSLLFLHADTLLPEGFQGRVVRTLERPGVVAGAFRLVIDAPGAGLRWVEMWAGWRSRGLQLPYGDQALFLTAREFRRLGGYRDMPVMEDFDLVRRLRRRGRVVTLPEAARTSARRWQSLGILRTTIINQVVVAGYLAGVPAARLARWYGRRQPSGGGQAL